MKDFHVADYIIRYYEREQANDSKINWLQNVRQLENTMFIAYGLFARKTDMELFESNFSNWSYSGPTLRNIHIDYGTLFSNGVLYPMYPINKDGTKLEIECIERAIAIMSKNADSIEHLLSNNSSFLPWANNQDMKYTEIPFDSIRKFFYNDNNIKILTGEKQFVEPTSQIER